jgi:hypothetical protein
MPNKYIAYCFIEPLTVCVRVFECVCVSVCVCVCVCSHARLYVREHVFCPSPNKLVTCSVRVWVRMKIKK